MQRSLAWCLRGAAYGILGLAPACLYLAGWIDSFDVGNADMLGVPAFLDALGTDGMATFSRWYWPSSPYFVPDFALYTPIWLLLPSPWLAPAGFMVVQLALLAWTGRVLARQLGRSEPVRWGALFSFSLIVLLAVHGTVPMRFVLVSYYRAGTFLAGVLGVALVLGMVRAGGPWSGRRRVVGVLVATVLLVCSDPLIVPSAIVPLVIVVAGLTAVPARRGGWSAHRGDGLRLALTLLGAVALGMMANGAIASDGLPYEPGITLAAPGHQLDLLVDVIAGLGPGVLFPVALALVILAAIAGHGWGHGPAVEPAVAVIAVWLLSIAGHGAAIVAGNLEPTSRYLQFVVGLPILAAGPAAADRLAPWLDRPAGPGWTKGRRALVFGLAAVPLLAVVVPAVAHLGDLTLSGRPMEAECLDDALPSEQPLIGLSGYWEGRLVQLHSRYERRLAVLDELGRPYRVNASSSWYDGPWSFAVVRTEGTSGFDPPLAWLDKLGPGSERRTCGPFTVLRFDPPILPDPFDRPSRTVTWGACELSTATGTVDTTACTIAVEANEEVGFGSYGGYTPLPEGRFEVVLRYRSPAPVDAVVADLELVRSDTAGEIEVVLVVALAGTDDEWRTVTAVLDIPHSRHGFVGETRTMSYGTYAYDVASVAYRRI